jgi:hypothetical protein
LRGEAVVDLTQHEQDVMAEICSVLASFMNNTDPSDEDLREMGEAICAEVDGLSSQFFGKLYDKFHRTGKNL